MNRSVAGFSSVACLGVSILTASMLMAGCASEKAPPVATKKRGAPTAKEAFQTIMANGDVKLSAAKFCDSVKGPEDSTFADYFTTVLVAQTDPDIRWFTEVTSKPLEQPKRWQVDVKFYGDVSGEAVDKGIRFVVDDVTRQMDRSSVACIGTS